MSRIKEERAEDWHVNAVGQDGQVCLRKLEGCAVLLNQLPHTLQEEQEDWGLTLWNIEAQESLNTPQSIWEKCEIFGKKNFDYEMKIWYRHDDKMIPL